MREFIFVLAFICYSVIAIGQTSYSLHFGNSAYHNFIDNYTTIGDFQYSKYNKLSFSFAKVNKKNNGFELNYRYHEIRKHTSGNKYISIRQLNVIDCNAIFGLKSFLNEKIRLSHKYGISYTGGLNGVFIDGTANRDQVYVHVVGLNAGLNIDVTLYRGFTLKNQFQLSSYTSIVPLIGTWSATLGYTFQLKKK